MNIREKYLELSKKEYTFTLIEELNDLKNICIKENNKEYFYFCDILISDIHIEHDNYKEALKIILKDIKQIDPTIFHNAYLAILDRLIYIYITKRNYQVALRYIKEKEIFIDKKDVSSLNRWYLELSYVYGEIGDTNKSIKYLKMIIDSSKDNDLLSHALSNITKLYIDLGKIKEAKQSLNSCLMIKQNHEGEVYCDYLLAKICVLENKNSDALQIFDEIFSKEDITPMTLSIVNDYLELLINIKYLDKALLVINKIALFMNATNDSLVRLQFCKNKIKYFVASNDVNNISTALEEMYSLEKEISITNAKIMNDNFEDSKKDLVDNEMNSVFNKIETLTNITNMAIVGESLRDIIMDFCKKVQKIIDFDEATFILFNKVDELYFLINNEIKCFRYNNSRLYEKTINYDELKNTIVEMMVAKNRPIALDLKDTDLSLIDVFSKSKYVDNNVRFLSAIPCVHKEDTFACLIFSSNKNDITNQNNTVLLNIATKLLSSNLETLFIKDNLNIINNIHSGIMDDNNIGVFEIKDNVMYLSTSLKQLLNVKYSSISYSSFIKKIAPSDAKKYEENMGVLKKFEMQFKCQLDEKIIPLTIKCIPYLDSKGKLLFHYGTILPVEKSDVTNLLSEKDLINHLNELKKNTDVIEFRFSMIRINASLDEVYDIKNNFGTTPYYLSDQTFVVILENEANQRVLDRLTKRYLNRVSIVRYPRDISSIDDMLDISLICLRHNKQYFSDDIYKGYIKSSSINSAILSSMESSIKLYALIYEDKEKNAWCEIKANVNGITDKENVYDFISGETLYNFDKKFIETFLSKQIKNNCFFNISNVMLQEIIEKNEINNYKNVHFVLFEKNQILPSLLEKIKELDLKVFINVSLIDVIDAYNFSIGLIEGIYWVEDVDSNILNKILRLANMFNLVLISRKEVNNIQNNINNIYYTDEIQIIE